MLGRIRRTSGALAIASTLVFAGLVMPSGSSAVAEQPLTFNLRTTDGGAISSEMLRGDVVVLAFGSSQLGSLSRALVEGVQQVADEYRNRNLRVYWVSTDSESPKSKNHATDAQLRAFAKKNGLKIAVLRDPDGALFKQTGADQLPAVVILDRQGNVAGAPVGGLDPNSKLLDKLAPRLSALLQSSN